MKFAHPSEKTFSEHLDLFDIEWIYEPVSFPLEWGSGSIKKMFTPDFYLPTLNLYVEITTICLLYTSPSPRDIPLSRMPSSA